MTSPWATQTRVIHIFAVFRFNWRILLLLLTKGREALPCLRMPFCASTSSETLLYRANIARWYCARLPIAGPNRGDRISDQSLLLPYAARRSFSRGPAPENNEACFRVKAPLLSVKFRFRFRLQFTAYEAGCRTAQQIVLLSFRYDNETKASKTYRIEYPFVIFDSERQGLPVALFRCSIMREIRMLHFWNGPRNY